MRRSCAPERISVGTFGSATGAGGAGEASGQAAQTGTRLLVQRRRRVERVEVAAGSACRAASASARRVAGAAPRCHGNGVSSHDVVKNSALFSSSCATRSLPGSGLIGTLGTSPSAIRFRRSSGSGSPFSAECTAAGQQRAQRRIQVARLEDVEQLELVQRHRVALARAVEGRPAEAVLAQPRDQAREVAERVGRDPGAGAVGAQLAERRRDRLRSARRRTLRGRCSERPSRAPALRRAAGSVRRTRARPSCRRRCRRGRASCSRPRGGSPRCLRPIPAS